jgi:hypothetical protein
MKFFLMTASVFAAGFAVAAEKPFAVPSDPKAQYVVLQKEGKGAERTIVTKREGTSGVSFARRLYNCTDNTVKYLGSGETLAGMAVSRPDPRMSTIVQGSIAYYIGVEACR